MSITTTGTRLLRAAALLVLTTAFSANVHAGPQLANVAEGSAGAISQVALGTIWQGLVVSAVRTGSGSLKLIAWDVVQADANGAGKIVRKGESTSIPVNRVFTVLNMGDHRFLTLVRDNTGAIKLLSWTISADGMTITKKGEAAVGTGTRAAVAFMNTGRFGTALRDNSGNLQVATWSISADAKTVKKLGSAAAGAVSELSIDSFYAGHDLYTPVRTGSNLLKVINWAVSDAGTLTRKGDATGSAIRSVQTIGLGELVQLEPGTIHSQPLTVASDGTKLGLTLWDTWDSLSKVAVKATASAEGGNSPFGISLVATPFQSHRLVTAIRDESGKLKLIAWNTANSKLVREGEATAGDVAANSDIAVTEIWSHHLLTAFRDTAGNMRLVEWKHSGP